MESVGNLGINLVDSAPPHYHVGAGNVGLNMSLDICHANIPKNATPALGFRNCLAGEGQCGMFEYGNS